MSVIGSAYVRYKYKSFSEKIFKAWIISCIALIIAYTLARTSLLPERKAFIYPLRTYKIIAESNWKRHGYYVVREAFGNIMLFIPLGISMSSRLKEDNQDRVFSLSAVMAGVCLSLLIELIQYFTRLGTFEIDDIIHNALGTAFGCCITASAAERFISSDIKIILYKLFPILIVISMICVICVIGIVNN